MSALIRGDEMKKHLTVGESVIWESLPGKRYRTVVFIRDVSIGVFISILFYQFFVNSLGEQHDLFPLVIKVTAGIIFLTIVFAVFHQLTFLFLRYMITTRQVMVQRGFIRRDTQYVPLEKIVNINKTQSISDRLLNIGTLNIKDANDQVANSGLYFANIDDPDKIRNKIHQALSSQKQS